MGMALFASLALLAGELKVTVLSGRALMVTGGSALVAIEGDAERLRVTMAGRDVTAAFRRDLSGRLAGRIDGLAPGRNQLAVEARGGKARLTLFNHPITGPVFSGPHQAPFICETDAAGLGPPLDTNCTAKTKVEYFYKAANAQGFKPFDPAGERPADFDFAVRRETGTINRAIYTITFRHEPGAPLPDPWTAGTSWNGRLIYSFGGGCRAGYHQARPVGGFDEGSLRKGYAIATSSLNVFGNNCNDVLSAETMMMVKEHFIKTYGAPVYTIGSGGSGGSMQQHLIAQNYPGLLDGITPSASYPDIATVVPPVVDCSLLTRAFEGGSETWTAEQKTAVSGYATWKTCESWMRYFSPALIRPDNCDASIPAAERYDPVRNPKGARCTIQDNHRNILGRDPATGFTPRPLDNDGVQYGLAAFEEGRITAGQFVELNERVGGYDADGNPVSGRTLADPAALWRAYETGRVNTGGGSLGSIPIIDFRPYLDPTGDIHDSVRSLEMRARLERMNHGTENHVMLTNPKGVNAVWLMDEWLGNIGRDTAGGTSREKIARNRPAGLTDACWTAEGDKVTEKDRCAKLYPPHRDPRMVAGAPLASDILKCSLKPVRAEDYRQPLTAEQLARLKAVFPRGVCDWSRPGVAQRDGPHPWQRY